MTHRLWTFTSMASIVGFAWISGCADDPKRKPKSNATVTTAGGVTTSTTDSTSGPGSSSSTASTSSATGTGTTGSTSGSGGTGGDGSGGTGGGGTSIGGSAGDNGTGGDGTGGTGTGGTGTGGDGTGGTGTGGTGGDGTGGDGTGGTGTGGTGGTGAGTGGTGAGTGGTGAGGTGGMGEGGQGGASPCDMSLLDTCGFESGTLEGWRVRGPVTLTPTTDDAYDGAYSLAVTGRSGNWQGAEYDILALVEPGMTYQATVYAKVISGGPTRVTLTRQYNCYAADDDSFTWVNSRDAVDVDTGWIELTGTFSVPADCTTPNHVLYVEASVDTAEFYIDEPLLIEQ